MKNLLRLLILCVLAACPAVLLAWASTDELPAKLDARDVASKGWPDRSLALLNDARRVRGWHPWFSELMNNAYFFAYKAPSMTDVNQLVALLGDFKTDQVVVELSPLGGGTQIKRDGPTTPAPLELRMVSQKEADDWFRHLDEAGRKKFGINQRPIMPPPTLTIYIGDPMIQLEKLVVPGRVRLESGVTIRDRNDAKQDASMGKRIETIERFVADYGVKHPTTAPATAPAKS